MWLASCLEQYNTCSQTNEITQKPRRIYFILRTRFVTLGLIPMETYSKFT